MRDELNRDEIILELDRIDTLWQKKNLLRTTLDRFTSNEQDEKENYQSEFLDSLKEFEEAQEKEIGIKRPAVSPARLLLPPHISRIENTIRDFFYPIIKGLFNWITAALLILGILFKLIPVGFIKALGHYFLIGGLCGCSLLFLLWFFSEKLFAEKVGLRIKKRLTAAELIYWHKKQPEWEEKFNKSFTKKEDERFIAECKEYDTRFFQLVEICAQKVSAEMDGYRAGRNAIEEKYRQEAVEFQKEFDEVSAQLRDVTLLTQEYFHMAADIASNLRSGRADTLKESLNLAIEEERKERAEEERREEARRQEELLEQQARDNRAHNAAMERMAEEEARATRAHNEAMERAAQEQARAAQEQTRIAQNQAREAQNQARNAQSAAERRCQNCVNSAKCSSTTKKSLSCGGYRPR